MLLVATSQRFAWVPARAPSCPPRRGTADAAAVPSPSPAHCLLPLAPPPTCTVTCSGRLLLVERPVNLKLHRGTSGGGGHALRATLFLAHNPLHVGPRPRSGDLWLFVPAVQAGEWSRKVGLMAGHPPGVQASWHWTWHGTHDRETGSRGWAPCGGRRGGGVVGGWLCSCRRASPE